MNVRVTLWFYVNHVVKTVTHNFSIEKATHCIAHVDRLARGYYTCREIGGKWVVDGRWAGMYPRIEFLKGVPNE